MKVTIHAYVHYHKYSWEDKHTYVLYSCNMCEINPEYALIKTIDVDVEIPDDYDPRPQQVSALRKEKSKILAEAQAKAMNIDEQISKLLAIEDKSEKETT